MNPKDHKVSRGPSNRRNTSAGKKMTSCAHRITCEAKQRNGEGTEGKNEKERPTTRSMTLRACRNPYASGYWHSSTKGDAL